MSLSRTFGSLIPEISGSATATVGGFTATSKVYISPKLTAVSVTVVVTDENVWYNAATQYGLLYVALQARDNNDNVELAIGYVLHAKAHISYNITLFACSNCTTDSITGACIATLIFPSVLFSTSVIRLLTISTGYSEKLVVPLSMVTVNLQPKPAAYTVVNDIVVELPQQNLFRGTSFNVNVQGSTTKAIGAYNIECSVDAMHPYFKTAPCHFYENEGKCRKANQCAFAHGEAELKIHKANFNSRKNVKAAPAGHSMEPLGTQHTNLAVQNDVVMAPTNTSTGAIPTSINVESPISTIVAAAAKVLELGLVENEDAQSASSSSSFDEDEDHRPL